MDRVIRRQRNGFCQVECLAKAVALAQPETLPHDGRIVAVRFEVVGDFRVTSFDALYALARKIGVPSDV